MGRPIVLFIAGMGRSGSTLLGDVLDTFQGYTAVGELHHIWGRGAVENWRCGDGPLFRDHPIWQSVVAAVEQAEPNVSLVKRAQRLERIRHNRRNILRLGLHAQPSATMAYRAEFEVVYRTLAKISGATVIVDTGKVPFHAAIMQSSPEVDFRVLHLVRDPCAVAFARCRVKDTIGPLGQAAQMQKFSVALTVLRWRRRRREVEQLAQAGRFATLSYEAFCNDPTYALRAVTQALDLPVSEADLDTLSTAQFTRQPGIAFSGNPNRLSVSKTLIKNDDRWCTYMPWYNKALVRLLGEVCA